MGWRIIYRPWEGGAWPQKRTENPRSSPFRSSYNATKQLLFDEVIKLQDSRHPDEVIVQVDVDEADIRLDGELRANSVTRSPGVIVSFESIHGPQRYCCDAFDRKVDNIRAIALGLTDLRRLDRYGITQGGAQYTGFKAIGSGIAMPAAQMTVEQAARFLTEHGGPMAAGQHAAVTDDAEYRERVFRFAAKQLHPDKGGDPALFKRLTDARDLLATS